MSDEFDPFKNGKDAAKKAFDSTKKKIEDNKTGTGLGAVVGGVLGAALTRNAKGAAAGGAIGGIAGAFISDQIRKGMPVTAGENETPTPRVKPPVDDFWKHLNKKKPGEPKKKDGGNDDPAPGP